jgi:hypothetical protein
MVNKGGAHPEGGLHRAKISGVHLHIRCTAIDRKQEAQTQNESQRVAPMGSTFFEVPPRWSPSSHPLHRD